MNLLRQGVEAYKQCLVNRLVAKGYDGLQLSSLTVSELEFFWRKELDHEN